MKSVNLLVLFFVLTGLFSFSSTGFCQLPEDSITVNFDNTSLSDAMLKISEIAGVGIVVDSQVGNKRITNFFSNVGLSDLMSAIARSLNVSWKDAGGVIIVGPKGSLTSPKSFFVSDPENAKILLSSFIDPAKISINKEESIVTIDADVEDMKQAELILQNL